jgi:hypothetical protein
LPVVALLALAGCESGFGSRQGGDPFLGIHAPPMPAQSTGGSASATQTATNTTPPLPASISVPNQAALASGTKQTPDNPRDLRIATPPVVPVSSPGGAASGNVRVDGPVPIPETTSKTMSAPAASAGMQPTGGAAVPPPPGASMTFEEAQQYLKRRGVVWQRLETRGDTGQWAFQCSLPLPGQTNINRTYETQAPLPRDPLSAVRAVIDKIEKDQH